MNLKLYVTKSCRYCHIVTDYIDENDLDVEIVDVTFDREGKMTIMEKGGKMQVPMLLIEGEKGMYESRDIVDWLKENVK